MTHLQWILLIVMICLTPSLLFVAVALIGDWRSERRWRRHHWRDREW